MLEQYYELRIARARSESRESIATGTASAFGIGKIPVYYSFESFNHIFFRVHECAFRRETPMLPLAESHRPRFLSTEFFVTGLSVKVDEMFSGFIAMYR